MAFGLTASQGALLGAVAGPVIGGLFGSSASGDASRAQVQAAEQASATQRYMYDQTRKDNEPFRATGLAANNKLAYLMGIGPNGQPSGGGGGAFGGGVAGMIASAISGAIPGTGYTPQAGERYGELDRRFAKSDLDADPVYQSGLQFGLDQGAQGINRQAAAGGSFLSGATLKALTRFGNDYGSTKANESYNRFNTDQTNRYNRYAGLSGAGQQATNQVSAAGANMANNVSANQIGAGNANASGYVGQANALNNGISGAYNAYQNNQMMQMLQRNPYGNSSYGPAVDASSYQG